MKLLLDLRRLFSGAAPARAVLASGAAPARAVLTSGVAPTRVVLTHSSSSYVEGLVPLLQQLDASVASTATPGRLSRSKGCVPHLTVSVTVPVMGGFKAIAKRGSLCQEVFFTTTLCVGDLQRALDARLGAKTADR